MTLLARLFYAAAIILFVIGLLVLLNVLHRVSATWVGLWVGAAIAALLGLVFDRRRPVV